MSVIEFSLSFCLLVVAIIALSEWRSRKKLQARFAPVIKIDTEIENLSQARTALESDVEKMREQYKEKKSLYDRLTAEAAIYNEQIEVAALGFYEPHFDFDTSEEYKTELKSVRSLQKEMIRGKSAVTCSTSWTVEGSKAKGKTMTNRNIRLTARAFNNECDAAVSNVSWNNAERMEQRIRKAFDAINKLNESNLVSIESAYLGLKINELRLAHEYQEKKKNEKEEQAENRRRMREEVALQKEVEKAASEEKSFESLLQKAQKQALQASVEERGELESRIAQLSEELEAAKAKSERAVSMAQKTRSGHIYVISNTGSFGEGVYKIGMTRRLDPLDRVKELGDASVPFTFDIHALIYTEDAPSLERALHEHFDNFRVNAVNSRKEFFRVPLDEIETRMKSSHPDAEFHRGFEAREFRETASLRDRLEKTISSSFPETI